MKLLELNGNSYNHSRASTMKVNVKVVKNKLRDFAMRTKKNPLATNRRNKSRFSLCATKIHPKSGRRKIVQRNKIKKNAKIQFCDFEVRR
jgi:hypothetical protein